MRKKNHNEYFRTVYTRAIQEYRLSYPWGRCQKCGGTCVDKLDMSTTQLVCQCGETVEVSRKPYTSICGYESSRKSCPTCHAKLEPGEFVWSWGEYINARWNTVTHFCKACFVLNVKRRLTGHTSECGCTVNLVGYQGATLPDWLTLEDHHEPQVVMVDHVEDLKPITDFVSDRNQAIHKSITNEE